MAAEIQSLGSFVWSIAEILRGDFKQSEYGKVDAAVRRAAPPRLHPRRLERGRARSRAKTLPEGVDDATRDMILFGAVGGNVKVYNLSRFTFATLKGQDPGQLHANLVDYITKFSANVRDIFLDKFLFTDQLKRLKEAASCGPCSSASPRSTCTPTRSQTSRWAICSRS